MKNDMISSPKDMFSFVKMSNQFSAPEIGHTQ